MGLRMSSVTLFLSHMLKKGHFCCQNVWCPSVCGNSSCLVTGQGGWTRLLHWVSCTASVCITCLKASLSDANSCTLVEDDLFLPSESKTRHWLPIGRSYSLNFSKGKKLVPIDTCVYESITVVVWWCELTLDPCHRLLCSLGSLPWINLAIYCITSYFGCKCSILEKWMSDDEEGGFFVFVLILNFSSTFLHPF